MVQAGMLAVVAIDKVYAAYRENQSVTNILCQMQRDKARGGHPQLNIYYSFILLFSIIFIFLLALFLLFSRLLLYFIELKMMTAASNDNDGDNNSVCQQPRKIQQSASGTTMAQSI
jgi:hypothetical protein